MIQLNIPKELKIKVWKYLQDNNVGQRGDADGNQEQQYLGLLGEYTVKYHLGMPIEFSGGFDGGFDMADIDEFEQTDIDIDPMFQHFNNQIGLA